MLMTVMQCLRRGCSRKEPTAPWQRCWHCFLFVWWWWWWFWWWWWWCCFRWWWCWWHWGEGLTGRSRLQPRLRRNSPFHFHLSSEYASINYFCQWKWCQNHLHGDHYRTVLMRELVSMMMLLMLTMVMRCRGLRPRWWWWFQNRARGGSWPKQCHNFWNCSWTGALVAFSFCFTSPQLLFSFYLFWFLLFYNRLVTKLFSSPCTLHYQGDYSGTLQRSSFREFLDCTKSHFTTMKSF